MEHCSPRDPQFGESRSLRTGRGQSLRVRVCLCAVAVEGRYRFAWQPARHPMRKSESNPTMPRLVPHAELTRIAAGLFAAVGAPQTEALVTAQELVRSNLMGLDSHGVIRIPEYLVL